MLEQFRQGSNPYAVGAPRSPWNFKEFKSEKDALWPGVMPFTTVTEKGWICRLPVCFESGGRTPACQ